MNRLWLLFSQTVTVALAAYFVVFALKPEWISGTSGAARVELAAAPPGPVPLGSFRLAAARASPAVVSINTSKTAQANPLAANPLFRFFYGDRAEQDQSGLGSGVIVSEKGFVLTNHHVVKGADEIEVTLHGRRPVAAKVVGTDPDTDLAVLKIDADNLPVIAWGSIESLQVGDRVLAIGNPFGVGQTVTGGIVSALGRNQLRINTFEDFIQTDAAINPGNSGGPLVDTQGNLVGINSAIYSRSGGSLGIGFAIPVSTARMVLDSIVKDGKVTRGWIGVEPSDLSAELAETFGVKPPRDGAGVLRGVIITGVLQGGPAARAGLQPGDVVHQVGGKPVGNVSQLLAAVAALRPGKSASIGVVRQAASLELSVTPGVRPKPPDSER
jgi:serine protease DegQ